MASRNSLKKLGDRQESSSKSAKKSAKKSTLDISDNSSEEKDGSKSPDDDYDFSIELKGPSSFSEEEFEDEILVNASKFSKQVPEHCKRFEEQKATGKKTAAIDSDVPKVFKVSDSDGSDRDVFERLRNIAKKSRTESKTAKKKITATRLVKPKSSGTRAARKSASKKVSNKQKLQNENQALRLENELLKATRQKCDNCKNCTACSVQAISTRYGNDQNTWEPRRNLAHLAIFKEYIAQHGSGKNYASKSSEALSSTRAAAKKAGDDEQSDPQKEEDEAAEIDKSGKDGDRNMNATKTTKSKLSTKLKRAAHARTQAKTRERHGGRFVPKRTNDGYDEEGDEVEKVLKRRVRPILGLAQKEAWEYLIKWKGRDKPTWETDVNVEHLPVVKEYITREDAAEEKPSTKSGKRVHTSTNNGAEDSTSSHSQDTRRSLRLSKRKRVTRQSARSGKQ